MILLPHRSIPKEVDPAVPWIARKVAATDGNLSKVLDRVNKLYADGQVMYLLSTEPLNDSLIENLFLRRQELFGKEEDGKRITLVLDSPGGDLHSAYNLVRLLRARDKKLRVVVPRWAKSAATLVCLAADELVMTDVAELGPLDPQVRRPGEVSAHSALDDYLSFQALNQEALTMIDLVTPFLVRRTGMNLQELLPMAIDFTTKLFAPVYQGVNPLQHGASLRTVEISKQYAQKVLRMWSNVKDVDQVSERITTGYPSHAYVVDVQEAKELGLNVRPANADEQLVLAPLVMLSQRCTLVGTCDVAERELVSADIEAAAAGDSEVLRTEATHESPLDDVRKP